MDGCIASRVIFLETRCSHKAPTKIKVCFKTLVTWIIKLYSFSNIQSGSIIQIVVETL